jgi:hypothetical protein
MKKLMLLALMAIIMIFASETTFAQYNSAKTKWNGECSYENWRQYRFHKKFTKKVKARIESAKYQKNFRYGLPGPRLKHVRRK